MCEYIDSSLTQPPENRQYITSHTTHTSHYTHTHLLCIQIDEPDLSHVHLVNIAEEAGADTNEEWSRYHQQLHRRGAVYASCTLHE